MLLVTLALKTLHSISWNRMDQITLNKQLGNHLNKDIINASSHLSICLWKWSLRAGHKFLMEVDDYILMIAVYPQGIFGLAALALASCINEILLLDNIKVPRHQSFLLK
jgi:hypothetical protein